MQGCRQLQSIHAGHRKIRDYDVAIDVPFNKIPESYFRLRVLDNLVSQALQDALSQRKQARVVVNDDNVFAIARRDLVFGLYFVNLSETSALRWQIDLETGAAIGLALDCYCPLVPPHDPVYYRKPHPRSFADWLSSEER